MEYPECEKLKANRERIETIMGFLEWFYSKGLSLPASDHGTRVMVHHYFGIDQNRLERERQHMIESMRIANEHAAK